MSEIDDSRLWTELCAAEYEFVLKRMALFQEAKDLTRVLATALKYPSQRGTALRILEMLSEAEVRPHLGGLVELASFANSDIHLARALLVKLERAWVIDNIEKIVLAILIRGTEDEYRRIAELYVLLDGGLLSLHLQRCAAHDDPEIQEIAADFAALAKREQ